MHILIAAGGTGGHILPAIAVAQALKDLEPDCEITFVGVGKDLEKKLVGEAGFPLESLSFVPLSGGGIRGLFGVISSLPRGMRRAYQLFEKVNPDVVVGFGGYPAVLPLITALLRGIPRVLHEQNGKVGIANRFLSLIANKIFAVHGARGFWSISRIEFVNNPVRKKFLEIAKWAAPSEGQALRVLIAGGSQGAVALNAAVVECADLFAKLNIEVTHQTGAKDFDNIANEYRQRGFANVAVVPFIDEMADAFAAAHLVICRAGAMTVAEVCASGRPAIFVPLVIAGGHQADNCRSLVQKSGALMLEQNSELVLKLREMIEHLVGHPDTLNSIAESARAEYLRDGTPAAKKIAEAIISEIA